MYFVDFYFGHIRMRRNLLKVWKAFGFLKAGNSQNKETMTRVKNDDCDATTNGLSDECYKSWMMEHPSAITSFDQMVSKAKGKSIVVFLDYDGTLSPIVDDPDLAFMSDEMRSAVREIAKNFPTAIISGRSREKVYEFVQLTEVYYAGSHGMDIMGPPHQVKSCDAQYQIKALDKQGHEVILFQPAKDFLPAIQKISNVLEEKTQKIEGALIEDNRFCISVHFRRVHEKDYDTLEEKVKSVVKNYPEFRLTSGKKVMEIRPSIKWDKGCALEYLLDTLGFSDSSDVLPLYIGDDRTDEDAFKVIRRRGEGYPIIVSSTPKETKAAYSLRDPSEVLSFLTHLAKWRNSFSGHSVD
ncbi:unnamed protein product, partial [Vitis vinifera]